VPLTADTGYLWFFDDANVEAVVKVLDACSISDHFWVFAAGLTNVEVRLSVADTATGRVRTYDNPIGTPFQPLQDGAAFATCGASGAGAAEWRQARAAEAAAQGATAAAAPAAPAPAVASPAALARHLVAALGPRRVPRPAHACAPGPEALCLQGGRFRVETEWETPRGSRGKGRAVPLTADTGYFWFFRDSNVEQVVKVHDACAFDQSFWVFAAGLTNVRVLTTVTDTHTGASRTYRNDQGRAFQPVQDTDAFPACP
jgi:hypothetical protein